MQGLSAVISVIAAGAPALKTYGEPDGASGDAMMWALVAGIGFFTGLILLVGSAPSEALRDKASPATVAQLQPGMLVRLQGALRSPQPVVGPVSGRPLAFLWGSEVEITTGRDALHRSSTSRETGTTIRDWGDGLTLEDATGAVPVVPFDCEMVIPGRVRAYRDGGAPQAGFSGTVRHAYDERGIPNGAEVVVIGRVEEQQGRLVIAGGHELLLSALSDRGLGKRHTGLRVAGALMVAVSGFELVLLAVELFAGGAQ